MLVALTASVSGTTSSVEDCAARNTTLGVHRGNATCIRLAFACLDFNGTRLRFNSDTDSRGSCIAGNFNMTAPWRDDHGVNGTFTVVFTPEPHGVQRFVVAVANQTFIFATTGKANGSTEPNNLRRGKGDLSYLCDTTFVYKSMAGNCTLALTNVQIEAATSVPPAFDPADAAAFCPESGGESEAGGFKSALVCGIIIGAGSLLAFVVLGVHIWSRSRRAGYDKLRSINE